MFIIYPIGFYIFLEKGMIYHQKLFVFKRLSYLPYRCSEGEIKIYISSRSKIYAKKGYLI